MVDDDRLSEEHFAAEGENADAPQNAALPAAVDSERALQEFEELDLSALLGQLVRRPRATWTALRSVLYPDAQPASPFLWEPVQPTAPRPAAQPIEDDDSQIKTRDRAAQLVLFVGAFLLALRGALVMVANHPFRAENPQLIEGTGWFLIAAGLWLVGEALPHRAGLWQRVRASTSAGACWRRCGEQRHWWACSA
jgi:hypothetical protein